MRKLLFVSVAVFFMGFFGSQTAYAQCSDEDFLDECAAMLDSYMFLKSFNINLTDGKQEFSYVFSKGTTYLITVCDKGVDGSRMVVELFDRNRKKVSSNFAESTNKFYGKILYPCNATGVYYLDYKFETAEAKSNCGVSILGFK